MLSKLAKRDWLWCLAIAGVLTLTFVVVGWYGALVPLALMVVAILGFFRDPHRRTPVERGLLVSPADGRISSIHRVEHFEPFGEPATCVRVFLSVFNVHVNRSPCHARVVSIVHTPGLHRNALNPDSAEVNENNLIVLHHPARDVPIAAVRQVAGLIARRAVCSASVGSILQRGQRMGIIKFASTAELYVPRSANATLAVEEGQKVIAGVTPIFRGAGTTNEPHPAAQPSAVREHHGTASAATASATMATASSPGALPPSPPTPPEASASSV